MDNKENKRKKDKHDDNEEYRKERRSKRARSRSPDEVRYNQKGRERDSRRERKHSKSRSPNVSFQEEKRRNEVPKPNKKKEQIPERKTKDTDMLNTRTGGAYIPPARLRMMQAQITDKSSVAYQRLAWEALKKSIHGHINKINVGNIGIIIKELLKENIVRGRGLLCRSVIQAQAASPTFTNVYAALVAAVNSRFPKIGELLLKRLVIQFKRGFKRNDKAICISSASFVAHLVNQRVAHEILALELLTLLVETPTDDSVEVAIAFLKECGQKLTEVSSKGVNAIFEMLRNILHEGQLDKRVQYMIEVMFQVWKDGFKDHPALIEELELVPEEEQFTHLLMLDDATDPQDILNVFKFDDKYEENEQKYKTLSKEILGSDAESDGEDGSGESGSEESEEEEEEEKKEMTIIDNTETNLVALRRTIYLTINSSLDFEECAHKLMKMQLKPGQEVELCHMFLDCCAEQRTYEKFYGLLAQRFCNINRIYIGPFEEIFKDSYSTAHRLDTNRLRNVSKFFAHLLFTDSISWEVMECVRLNEEDTTSSSRIYIKILFQELAEYMGLKKLNERLKDLTLQEAFSGLFPRDNPKNTRFSINFFTSIGLGGLTDELREHLKQMPKNVPVQITEIKLDSSSDDSSSSSSSSDDSSSSDSSSSESSGEENSKKIADKNKQSKEKKKQAQSMNPDEETNDKNKQPQQERWGHDGFYDTYGQGARRMNSRPEKYGRPNAGSRRDDNREEFRHRDNQSNCDGRRDYRREDTGKDEYRRNRDESFDARRIDREEYRRDRNYNSDRRRQNNDNEFGNGDPDGRSDRRRIDTSEYKRSDRAEMNNRGIRNSDEKHKRYREEDKDRRRQRDEEDGYKDGESTKNRRNDREKGYDEENRKDFDDNRSKKKHMTEENDSNVYTRGDKRNNKEKKNRRNDREKDDDEEYRKAVVEHRSKKKHTNEEINSNIDTKDDKRNNKEKKNKRNHREKGDDEENRKDIDDVRSKRKHMTEENDSYVDTRDKEKRNRRNDRAKGNDEENRKDVGGNRSKRKHMTEEYDSDVDTRDDKRNNKEKKNRRNDREKIDDEDTRDDKRNNKEKKNRTEDAYSNIRQLKDRVSKVNMQTEADINKSKRYKESAHENKSDKDKRSKGEVKRKKNKKYVSSSSDSSSSDSSSSNSTTSSSSSEDESKKRSIIKSKLHKEGRTVHEAVSNRRIPHGKHKDRTSSDCESDDRQVENDTKKLGGRYWDVFDIGGAAENKSQNIEKHPKKRER